MLPKLITQITLDPSAEKKTHKISAKCGDKATRWLSCLLLAPDGTEYTAPADAILATNFKTPDGRSCYNTASADPHDPARILVELTSQLLAVPGTLLAELEIRSADGTQILTSCQFEILVGQTLRDEKAILARDEMTALDALLTKLLQNNNRCAMAETARSQAEEKRTTAESARSQAEEKRTTAESARAQAEEKRTTAESARAQAEEKRATAETARAQAEEKRVTAETARAQAEEQRVTAETARAQAEEQRVTAETARAQKIEEIKNKLEENLLWENAAPDSPFPEGAIPLPPCTAYRFLQIDYLPIRLKDGNAAPNCCTVCMTVDGRALLTYNTTMVQYRLITIDGDSLRVSDCGVSLLDGNPAHSNLKTNDNLIPYKIYGIKK